MDARPAASTMLRVTFPIVTELPPVLEPITADTFIACDKRLSRPLRSALGGSSTEPLP